MIVVDAENAFNSLNRHASLLNTGVICPEFSKYLTNTYRQPSKLFVNGTDKFILSKEGSTQGDNNFSIIFEIEVLSLFFAFCYFCTESFKFANVFSLVSRISRKLRCLGKNVFLISTQSCIHISFYSWVSVISI